MTDLDICFRSSHSRCSVRKSVLRNVAKFTGWKPPNILITWQNISIFRQKNLYPSSISKKIGAPYRKDFSKNLVFIPFTPCLTVSEVFTSWNKYWIPHELSKNVHFYLRQLPPPVSFRDIFRLSLQIFLDISTMHVLLCFY